MSRHRTYQRAEAAVTALVAWLVPAVVGAGLLALFLTGGNSAPDTWHGTFTPSTTEAPMPVYEACFDWQLQPIPCP